MTQPKRYWYEKAVDSWRIYDRKKSAMPKVAHYIAVTWTEGDAETIVKALNRRGSSRREKGAK